MDKVYQFLIRVSAFLAKEIFGILRQPMLVLTLVLGPFLILFLFGVGFRNEPRALRTLFVVNEESNLADEVEAYATSLGPQLIFMGVTGDQAWATRKLSRREVDVVAVVPPNADELIRNNEQAVFELKHYEIDPFQIDYVNIFGRVYADAINRRILRAITERGQREAATIEDALQAARQSTTGLREAVRIKDEIAARRHQQGLKSHINDLALAVGPVVGVLDGVQETVGADDDSSDAEAILNLLSEIQEDVDALEVSDNTQEQNETETEKIERIEEKLDELTILLDEFQRIDARILVSPFRSETESISAVKLQPSDYFAPAVIVLLLQHLAVTFGALSIVHEREAGTMEIFRVSPISSLETLLGKYLSYLLFTGILLTILSLIVVFGLGVPMLGDWTHYGLSLLALVFTSLGFGFVISLLAKTDSQAVQYSMIMLLTSVFFSGAFLSLQSLWDPVQVVSWAMPATYGILLLQNIMLRGYFNSLPLIGLAVIGVVLFVVAWLLLRRLMART